jgi:hypothetical protein
MKLEAKADYNAQIKIREEIFHENLVDIRRTLQANTEKKTEELKQSEKELQGIIDKKNSDLRFQEEAFIQKIEQIERKFNDADKKRVDELWKMRANLEKEANRIHDLGVYWETRVNVLDSLISEFKAHIDARVLLNQEIIKRVNTLNIETQELLSLQDKISEHKSITRSSQQFIEGPSIEIPSEASHGLRLEEIKQNTISEIARKTGRDK